MDDLYNYHDASIGICWDVICSYIYQYETEREEQLNQYRPWLSKVEQKEYSTGNNVYLTGYSICNHGDERTVEILWKYKDGCVLKGMKFTPPSILEKLARMKFGGY